MDHSNKRFVISASDAESMAQSMNLPSVLHLLPHLVQSAQSLARPPISNYPVGAVGLGSEGRIFFGVNVEFLGVPLHHSVHAEQFLATNAAVHGCRRLLSIAVSAAPCGHCRQFFQELRHSSSLQILITNEQDRAMGTHQNTVNGESFRPLSQIVHENGEMSIQNGVKVESFRPLSQILPSPFGPSDLLDQETPLLLEEHDNGLCLLPLDDVTNFCNGENGKLSNGNCEKYEKNEFLMKAALQAANKAHAPYSGCPSGVSLMDCEGKVYKGSYVESAAYNPSFGPVQAALVAYVAEGGGGYEQIVAAALVEKDGAKIKQEDTASLLLKAISPKCELKTYHCYSAGNGYKKVPA